MLLFIIECIESNDKTKLNQVKYNTAKTCFKPQIFYSEYSVKQSLVTQQYINITAVNTVLTPPFVTQYTLLKLQPRFQKKLQCRVSVRANPNVNMGKGPTLSFSVHS